MLSPDLGRTDKQYTLCDIILLFQVFYYRRSSKSSHADHASEASPLLAPSSPSSATRALPPAQPKPLLPPVLEYPLLLTFVLGAGAFAWFLSDRSDDVGIPEEPGKGGDVELEWKSQTLGYISAVLYLGSRIPQIAHNLSVSTKLPMGCQYADDQQDAMCGIEPGHVLLFDQRQWVAP